MLAPEIAQALCWPMGAKSAHSCSMRIIESVRKYAAEQGLSEDAVLKKGTEAKSKEFVEKGAEVYAQA